jgi:hypothetical protein
LKEKGQNEEDCHEDTDKDVFSFDGYFFHSPLLLILGHFSLVLAPGASLPEKKQSLFQNPSQRMGNTGVRRFAQEPNN